MIKMIKYSYNKISPPLKRFYSVVFLVILIFGLFSGLFPKNTLASNNYIDNIQFYKDENGYYRMKFHVKTSWDVSVGSLNDNGDYYCYISPAFIGDIPHPIYNFNVAFMIFPGKDNTPYIDPSVCGSTIHYVAGNTYDTYIFVGGNTFIPFNHNGLMCNKTGNCSGYDFSYEYNFGSATSNSYITNIGNYGYFPSVDTEKYYFTEYPNLTITYPHDNDTIAGAFTIQGSYTIPSNGYYDILEALLAYQSQSGTIGSVRFYQKLSTSSGEVNIPIEGIPANNYVLGFLFLNFHDCFELGDCGGSYYYPDIHIHLNVVQDIPPALPSGETPPVAPIYNPLDPIQWHNSHSSDTPSDLYLALTNTFSPLITNLGSNLVAFAGQFTGSQAQAISDNVSNAIITIKSYANNLNSFFNGLPVIQLLTGYILVFLAITIFRLAKGIIGLFKI